MWITVLTWFGYAVLIIILLIVDFVMHLIMYFKIEEARARRAERKRQRELLEGKVFLPTHLATLPIPAMQPSDFDVDK
jgi:hypothetical protein